MLLSIPLHRRCSKYHSLLYKEGELQMQNKNDNRQPKLQVLYNIAVIR